MFSIDVDKVIGITKIHQYREIIGMQELLDENNDRESLNHRQAFEEEINTNKKADERYSAFVCIFS